jgi:hypothetical protein
MLKRMLTALLITLVTTSACGPRVRMTATPGRTQSPESGATRSPDVWRQLAQRVTPGTGVRVVLVDGTRMRAVLLAAEDASIVLKRRTRLPEPEQRIAYGQLEMLEIDSGGGIGAGKAAAIGIGAGAAAFLTLLMITFAVIDD